MISMRRMNPAPSARSQLGLSIACLAFLAVVSSTGRTVDAGVPETIQSVQPRMVKIFGAGGIRNLYAYSTGFLVSEEGHIVTVWSHVLDGDSVSVVLDDGRRYDAKVLGAEPTQDLAVLKIEAEELDLPFFNLSESRETVGPGRRVLAFSNMFKVATGDEPVSVLHGVIAARTKLTTRRGAFETPYKGSVLVVDCISNNPGAGGGVVVTNDGQLVGMIGKELRNAETNTWLNYAIPIDEIEKPINEIIEGRFERSDANPTEDDNPRNYKPLDFGIVMVPDVLFRTPAYVDSVIADSPADQSGVTSNDLIMFVNDQLIQSVAALRAECGRLEAGDTVRVVVRREDQLQSIEMLVPRKTTRRRP